MTESKQNEHKIKWHTSPDLWEKLKPLARQMRTEPTEAENILWGCLRGRRLAGYKFRRQHAVGRFIVDFYCAEAAIVIEVDGSIHQYNPMEDSIRQAYLESTGLRILRFSNEQIRYELEGVMSRISNALTSPLPLSVNGEGTSPGKRSASGSGGEV